MRIFYVNLPGIVPYCAEHIGVQRQYFTRQAEKPTIAILQLFESFGGLLQVFKSLLTFVTTEDRSQYSHFVFNFLGEVIMFQLCWNIMLTKFKYLCFLYINGSFGGLSMPSVDFKHMFNFLRFAYNYGCVIRVALNFHRAYVFGDVSSDSLVCLDHVDQGDGTQPKQDHTIWAPLSHASLNINFVCRLPIYHDLACDILVQHPCQVKESPFEAQGLHRHE